MSRKRKSGNKDDKFNQIIVFATAILKLVETLASLIKKLAE